MTDATEKGQERDERGHFRPGQSGNPAGRSKGAMLLQGQLRRDLEALAPEAIKKLAELVKKGHPIAIRLLLERVMPPPKSGPISAPVELDGLSPPEQAARVVSAMAAGALTLEDALALMTALASAQRLKDADELRQRLAEVEARLEALTGTKGKVIDTTLAPESALPAPKAGGDE